MEPTQTKKEKIMNLRETNDTHRITIKKGPLNRFPLLNDKEYA